MKAFALPAAVFYLLLSIVNLIVQFTHGQMYFWSSAGEVIISACRMHLRVSDRDSCASTFISFKHKEVARRGRRENRSHREIMLSSVHDDIIF